MDFKRIIKYLFIHYFKKPLSKACSIYAFAGTIITISGIVIPGTWYCKLFGLLFVFLVLTVSTQLLGQCKKSFKYIIKGNTVALNPGICLMAKVIK